MIPFQFPQATKLKHRLGFIWAQKYPWRFRVMYIWHMIFYKQQLPKNRGESLKDCSRGGDELQKYTCKTGLTQAQGDDHGVRK